MKSFQFALVRYVHNLLSGEFVNVGIVMWIPSEHRARLKLNTATRRLTSFFPGFDRSGYQMILRDLEGRMTQMCDSKVNAEQLDCFLRLDRIEQVLPLLLREDSSCFQWSQIMSGIHDHPERRFEELFEHLVRMHEPAVEPRDDTRRDEDSIIASIESKLEKRKLGGKLRKHVEIKGRLLDYTFEAGWQNGVSQVLEPISFDLQNQGKIQDKAIRWAGRLYSLSRESEQFQFTAVIAPPSSGDLAGSFTSAKEILASAPMVRKILMEDEFDDFIPEIERDLENNRLQR